MEIPTVEILIKSSNELKEGELPLFLEALGRLGYAASSKAGDGFCRVTADQLMPPLNQRQANIIFALQDCLKPQIVPSKTNFEGYGAQALVCAEEDLVQLYKRTALCPGASTQLRLRTNNGIALNGVFHASQVKGAIVVDFGPTPKWRPSLIKFPELPGAVRREYHAIQELSGVKGIIGPVSLVPNHGQQHLPCNVGEDRDPRLEWIFKNTREGLNMPRYSATMSDLPYPVDEEDALVGGWKLKATVDGIHKREWCHNDIKPSNIFLDSTGDPILGDFGAATKVGSYIHEFSAFYWPGGAVASYENDYFCLAVTLLEITKAYTPCGEPRLRELRECTNKLKSSELKAFVLDMLPVPSPQFQGSFQPGTPPQPSSVSLPTGALNLSSLALSTASGPPQGNASAEQPTSGRGDCRSREQANVAEHTRRDNEKAALELQTPRTVSRAKARRIRRKQAKQAQNANVPGWT